MKMPRLFVRHVAGRPQRSPRHRACGHPVAESGRHTVTTRGTDHPVRWRRVAGDNRILFTIGVLASLGLVWGGTTAAFTSTTPSGSNSWSTGTVTLSDDDGGAALFTAAGLVPGSSGSNCIAVSYTGTVAATVRLYASASTDPSTVASYLDLTVQEGSGGGFGTCTGFAAGSTVYSGTLAGFTGAKTSFATGVGTWTPPPLRRASTGSATPSTRRPRTASRAR